MAEFAVVIPVYNREKVIARAVQSVQNQTFKDWELIIIDDGSVDGTAMVVKSFLTDSRIKYIWQENKGAQAARNHGLSLAKGEYICFLDSDDELLPDFMAEMLAAYQSDASAGCVYCWTGMQMPDGFMVARKDSLEGDIYAAALAQGYITSPSFMTMRRSCFERIGPWDESLKSSQDDDICFRLAKFFRYKLIRKVLAIYHADYEGNENRIGASELRVAQGWLRLWQKFEDEVVEQCGAGIMCKHYLKCFRDLSMAGGDSRSINIAWEKAKEYATDSVEREERALLENCKEHNVYCYGAGKYGQTVANYLLRERILIKAFVVSDGEDVVSPLPGISCLQRSDVKDEENSVVLLAASEKHQAAMRQALGDTPVKILPVSAGLQAWLQVRLDFDRA